MMLNIDGLAWLYTLNLTYILFVLFYSFCYRLLQKDARHTIYGRSIRTAHPSFKWSS
jgi:hypothetical protein